MSLTADFGSISAADSAYYGDGGGGGGGGGGTDGDDAPADGGEWMKPTEEGTTAGGCSILRQDSTGGASVRFFTITSDGGTTVAVKSGGGTYTVDESTTWSDLPDHPTKRAAERACQKFNTGSGGGGSQEEGQEGQGGEGSTQEWGDLEPIEVDWAGGWQLFKQTSSDGSTTRFFVLRQTSGSLEALTASGTVEDVSESSAMGDVPHTGTESEARAAYEKWAKENPEEAKETPGEDGDGAASWGDWAKIRQVGDWVIFGRTHKTEDRVQFVLAGKTGDGTTVYLDPEGMVVDEPHIYESVEAVKAALEAYSQRKANGEVPEDRQPTGDAPSTGEVAEDAANSGANDSGGDNPLSSLLDAAKENPVLAVVAVGGAGYVYTQEYGGN